MNKNVKIALWVLAGSALLFLVYQAGQNNVLNTQLAAIDEQLAAMSSSRNPEGHLKLLAKRKAIQDLLNK